MNLKRIINTLQVKAVHNIELKNDIEIKGCYIGDLLSNVMAHAQSGQIWITVQTHQNVVALAQLLNLPAIVFVDGHKPQAETIDKAQQEGIYLFATQETAYEIATSLYTLGVGRAEK